MGRPAAAERLVTIALGRPADPPGTAQAFAIGERGARLLAGPPGALGPERLGHHLERLGSLPISDRERLQRELEASGLTGRGGGGFPAARKLGVARAASAGRPRLIVNASESEPASAKDRTLCTLRPHLVLDGAAASAALAGATEVVLYLHRGADDSANALRHAVAERQAAQLPDPSWHLGMAPARYVAGEASAAASWLEGGEAKPLALRLPLAAAGVAGRPTVVHNVETVAHLGLIARFGAEWWRRAGTPEAPGSRLVTVHHGGPRGAAVLEVVEPVTVGRLLAMAPAGRAAADDPSAGTGTAAVLVGGYAGRWSAADAVRALPFSPEGLATAGVTPGCGLLAPLPSGACGVAATAVLARWLAVESAGQCGPCLFGLADVAEAMQRLVQRASSRREVRNLRRLLGELRGKGGCHHPDGVITMVESGLDVFADEVDRHARRRRCSATVATPDWPLPDPDEGWR